MIMKKGRVMYVNPLLTVFAYAITPKDCGSKLGLNII
jgi:hypothetical protein